jgi:hypothetical protein
VRFFLLLVAVLRKLRNGVGYSTDNPSVCQCAGEEQGTTACGNNRSRGHTNEVVVLQLFFILVALCFNSIFCQRQPNTSTPSRQIGVYCILVLVLLVGYSREWCWFLSMKFFFSHEISSRCSIVYIQNLTKPSNTLKSSQRIQKSINNNYLARVVRPQ